MRKSIVKLIKEYHCENIIYYGWLHPKNIPQYLDDINVGLIPLLDKTHFNLSKCPVKLFEYMAKAKPTVSSSTGEAENIISDGKNGFLAYEKDEFIKKMENLISNADLCLRIGKMARETVVENYSLKILVKRFYSILKDMNV